MSKRPTKRELDDVEAEQLAQKYAGQGLEHIRLSDYGSMWAKCAALPPEFLDLLDQIDRTKEPRLLLPLILPNVPPEVRPHFVDLFERLEFKSRSRKTPSYRPSDAQQKLLGARYDVKNRGRGVTRAQAIADAARSWGISESALNLAVKGQHTSLRHQGRGHK
jgi:hypothetical protein